VALSPDGGVRAMVGGRDYATSEFNRATQALRQPGSAFKAFVFLAAFERGMTPDSPMFDGPIKIGNWAPRNYENSYRGDVTVREAFARSLNSVAVQISERIGRAHVVEAARRLGITSDLTPGPSIALGASGVSLLELTGAYATFDNGGYGVWPRGIEQIRDRSGAILYQRTGGGPGLLVQPRQVASMQDVLTSVVEWGTGRRAKIGRPAAGKTGTGQDFRDAWFVGFTAELVTGVWLGNDDNRPMKNITGGGLPAQLWHNFMSAALDGAPARPLPQPDPTSQIAALIEQLEDQPPAPNGARAARPSESLQDWLGRIVTQRGSNR
jgi:penicillin-binding protein 1A